ncbi:LysM peptidoglycan-binding domain-containing protein [Clostridium thermarum]|uniref:LysM peptidoglycan-binding domain-containing protein n=1 Tax=Clostridium thermarum TaxID=1716543 RepID=UPI0013D79075|nr:LysM peptidoglycan-binding domain-containing protein [Clostridium thermarum]
MDKNKRIFLVVLLVVGILLCSWSIYNSILTMSQNNNSASSDISDSDKTSQNKDSNSKPVVIDDADDDDDKDDDRDDSDSDESNSSTDDYEATETSSNANEKYITYTVGEDETLKDICEQYSDKVPVSLLSKAILLSNNLKNSKDIKEGMTLKIPEKYTGDGFIYTVKIGDSISSIVSRFMSDLDYMEAVEKLKADNYLTSDTIKIGDELFVAVSDLSLVNDYDRGSDINVNSETEYDSEGTSIDDGDSISASSTLRSRIGNLTTYTVKENETLATISRRFSESCPPQTAANIILKVNGLSKSDEIEEGMTIKIPEEYLSQGTIYKVQVGDTLTSIVEDNFGDMAWYEAVAILSEDNNLKKNMIFAGQELFIPSID